MSNDTYHHPKHLMMRILDRQVAENVMGWNREETVLELNWIDEDGNTMGSEPEWSPSTHIYNAWEVLEKLRDWGWAVSIASIESSNPDETWQVDINKCGQSDWFNACEATAPLAICKAVLKVVIKDD